MINECPGLLKWRRVQTLQCPIAEGAGGVLEWGNRPPTLNAGQLPSPATGNGEGAGCGRRSFVVIPLSSQLYIKNRFLNVV
jgi:hypothetical protein